MIQKNPTNFKIMRDMTSKLKRFDPDPAATHIILYSFFYKYASDILKEHLMTLILDRDITFEEAYRNPEYYEMFRKFCLENFGYFITRSAAFFDEIMAEEFSGRFFIEEFLDISTESLEFEKNSQSSQYFEYIINTVRVNARISHANSDSGLTLGDFIYSISRLSLDDEKLTFAQVFSIISTSRPIRAGYTPEYISAILSRVVSAQKPYGENVYDPFSKDASLLVDFSKQFALKNTYGKESNSISYLTSLIRLFIEGFSWDDLYLVNENAFEEPLIADELFDVVISKVPNSFKALSREKYSSNMNMSRSSKILEIEDLLTANLDIDEEYRNSSEFKQALDVIVKANKNAFEKIEFSGEYEPLGQSEFLFLIRLISSLKNDGVMAISISQNFLFKGSLALLRKYLTYEKNYIDAIISVPPDLGRSIRPDVIIIFKKKRMTDDIVFIEVSSDYKATKSPNAVPGSFRRNLILDDASLDKIVETYMKRENVDRFSNVVKISDLAENDFNLSISRYVDTYEGKFINLDDLKKEKEEIDENMERLTQKIDNLMRELDIRF